MKRREKVYTLHRYIDENGVPDFEKIFSKGESKLWYFRHLDPGLKKIWRNQPDVVQKEVEKHLGKCDECKNEFEDRTEEPKAGELLF